MTTGLVLSGGGIRGVAHLGAIKALEEYGIYPSHIAGTSAGAIVGALYASGCTWEQMLDFFKTTEIFSLTNYAMGKPGFLDTEKFHRQLKAYIPVDTFESLERQLFVTATNLLDGTLHIFSRGELIKPVLASAAVPGLFAPVQIEKGYYVDGGTLNNFPVDLIKKYCDLIVGVYVNPFSPVSIKDLNHVNKVLERAYHVMVANETTKKFKDCDLLIRPSNMDKYSMFSLKNLDIILELGYNATINALKNNPISSELLSEAELEAMNGFSLDTAVKGNPKD
ncbi:patatin-like phospholipase family protein [Arenibacter sp. M-2]|uniref:patatin-like phospholipase family protein n=1 Tax=Arenibacter sp. M-2 TaxID=3053612 RepID=UPI0025712694|nr:patatin-like phospholipase family protein [Arenibacter sp. M-2]MDL5512390.1 patatin-like phospholipase family protein [Arenibacter sp. M-2]|tara:strand:- start:2708 stop:3547 length:840 start_codon:yes stop_codon:yes gene_type:complete